MSIAFLGKYAQVPVLATLIGLAFATECICIAVAFVGSSQLDLGHSLAAGACLIALFVMQTVLKFVHVGAQNNLTGEMTSGAYTGIEIIIGGLFSILLFLGVYHASRTCGFYTTSRQWLSVRLFEYIWAVVVTGDALVAFIYDVPSGPSVVAAVVSDTVLVGGAGTALYLVIQAQKACKSKASAMLASVAAPLFCLFAFASLACSVAAVIALRQIVGDDVPRDIVTLGNAGAALNGMLSVIVILSLVIVARLNSVEKAAREVTEDIALEEKLPWAERTPPS